MASKAADLPAYTNRPLVQSVLDALNKGPNAEQGAESTSAAGSGPISERTLPIGPPNGQSGQYAPNG